MSRISLILLFACIAHILFGQDTMNVTNSSGHKQGYWRKVDSAGRVIYTGRFTNGVPDGSFCYYYPDGKLKTTSSVSGHGQRAVTISYFPNGRKMAAGNYLEEKKDSVWQFFSESNGTLVSEETYKAGIRNGLARIYYPEGGLSEQVRYLNGIKDGTWEQYYLDGKIKLQGSYKAGEKHGRFTAFYNSATVMISGQYTLGHQEGTWIFYQENGAVAKKEFYDNGILVKTELTGK